MERAKNPLTAYYARCLQINLPVAIQEIRRASATRATIRKFKQRVQIRFVTQRENLSVSTGEPFVDEVVSAYREYYRAGLLRPKKRIVYENELKEKIRAIAVQFKVPNAGKLRWAHLEKSIHKAFLRRGFHSLFGRVAPFLSLLVWQSERKKQYKVKLSHGTEKVKVVHLDAFVDIGWLHLATFGRYYVGGWAKKDALYCVSQAYRYNYQSEAFRVSYLTHEAQHFSDYKRFPGLGQADLEFRAKLAELIASSRPKKLLNKFSDEARKDKALPHCFAAYKIIHECGLNPNNNMATNAIHEIAAAAMSTHSALLRRRKNEAKKKNL